MNGSAGPIELAAKSWLVSETWVRVASIPYLISIPEKHRLLMLISLDYPHRPALIRSDDEGSTWSDPVYFGRQFTRRDDGAQAYTDGLGLTYLGGGRVTWVGQYRGAFTGQFAYEVTFKRWFSDDDGDTWSDRPVAVTPVPIVAAARSRPLKTPVSIWDPMLVERDARTGRTKCYETGYYSTGGTMSGGYAWAYLRTSTDGARTWSEAIQPPQWAGVNEVALCRAHNGDLIAACRTVAPPEYQLQVDNWNGLAVSVSRDDGKTWSALNHLYAWGRQHPCMVVRPNGEIVMSYVVRRGYTDDAQGFPRFGVEAVVSRDQGRSWDLDHKYILASWSGTIRREGRDVETDRKYDWDWLWANPQATTSLLLPDGSILTAFGTGFRMQKVKVGRVLREPTPMRAPYDIGIVRWKVNEQGLNSDHAIADAPYDSDRRNLFDPETGR